MKIIGANVTGSFILNSQDVTTTIQTSNVWSGSVATDITALNASTASLNAATASLLNYTSSNNAAISDILLETASFNAFSSSILNYTSSTTTAIADILLETASINLLTASLLSYTASQASLNGTFATTGSNTFTGIQTVNSNLVVTGSITAQTLIVQTITSSQDFVTGSTKFGSLAINTHQFTGSVIVTGSLNATAFTGSGAGLTSIPNAALTNSTISGISLGSNLATLTIGTGLSGTSYNGSGAVTIANTGVTSIVAGTGISINQGTGAVTVTNTITNNNQLTNGAGYITSAGNSATTSQTTFSTLTSTGAITANSGGSYSATLGTIASSWGGNSTYPTLYGSTVDRWVMHMNMHISYTANGVNGFGGSMTGATIRMASDTAATHYWDIGPGTSGVGTDKFSIGRNATSLFSITSGGIIGINTASPLNTAWGNDSNTKQLSMYGSGYAVINLEGANGGTTRKFSMGVGDSRFYMCYDNTAARHNLTINSDGLATFGGAITAVGDITAFSDFRLKENVLTITNPLSKVMSLRGVTYNRTDLEDKSTKIGFIAQDVKEVIPEVVTYNEEQDKYGVSYGNVTALLVEAIKEQQTQIEELKTIINALTK